MKINLNLVYYTHKTYSDGTHPIILQYSANRKIKRKVLTRCLPENWDNTTNRLKSTAPNSTRINHFLNDEYLKAERDLYDLKSGEKTSSQIFAPKIKLTLQQAFDAELLRLEREYKSGLYDKVLAMKRQVNNISVNISDIDKKWFENLIYEMKELGNIGSTIQKKIKMLKGIIARYSENGISNELRTVRVPIHKSIKIKLNTEELERIEQLDLPNNDRITAARDLFILQIYLRGIRVGDLLQAYSSDFRNGRFHYKEDKTGKTVSIKIIEKAQPIIDRYKNRFDRLFPFFSWKPDHRLTKFENDRKRLKHKESCTTIINKHLKVIAGMTAVDKPLSSHIARHTFARMAIDKINNPMITMELLGHSSLIVHQQYLNDIRNDDILDRAADDIFA